MSFHKGKKYTYYGGHHNFLDRYGHEMETLVKKKKTLFEECTFPCPYHKSQFLWNEDTKCWNKSQVTN